MVAKLGRRGVPADRYLKQNARSQQRIINSAIRALSGLRYRVPNNADRVPAEPGLYAIYGSAETWQQLGLCKPPDDRPLYVGKAEDSLVGRDLQMHFADGLTGFSTVR